MDAPPPPKKEIKGWSTNVPSELAGLRSKISELWASAREAEGPLEDAIETLKFKISEKANEKRSFCTSLRHKKERWSKCMAAAGFHKELSKGLHNALFYLEQCGRTTSADAGEERCAAAARPGDSDSEAEEKAVAVDPEAHKPDSSLFKFAKDIVTTEPMYSLHLRKSFPLAEQ